MTWLSPPPCTLAKGRRLLLSGRVAAGAGIPTAGWGGTHNGYDPVTNYDLMVLAYPAQGVRPAACSWPVANAEMHTHTYVRKLFATVNRRSLLACRRQLRPTRPASFSHTQSHMLPAPNTRAS